jgi:hypothetical protein
MAHEKMDAATKPHIARVEVYWHTVKYRTVVLYVLVVTSVLLAAAYLVFPETSGSILRKISDVLESHENNVAAISARQARFVNLDGHVQIKKNNSVQWVNADYQITLDRGDLVQTDSEGVARIAFADGTTYTVKGDSLVTVEENNVTQDQATSVGVHIASGQVDLATGTWQVPGSKAEVTFENAVASAKANSRLAVVSDPQTKEEVVTVDAGAAQLNRGTEHVDIGQYERASFAAGNATPITKTQILAPPQLVEPLNLQPIIAADPKHDNIHFAWNPGALAKQYDFQVSTTSSFSHIVTERRTVSTSVDANGLDPGDYFWRVRAIDDKNNISDASESFKFTLVAQAKEQAMLLEVDGTQLEGSVVEVIGRTEPGAALIVNGEQVADIQTDGTFRYFTQPMDKGSHDIVITGQNRRGGTAIKRVTVVIP